MSKADGSRRRRRREPRHREVRPGGRRRARRHHGPPDRRRRRARLGAAGVPRVRAGATAARHRHARLPLDRDRLPRGLPARGARDPAADRRHRRGAATSTCRELPVLPAGRLTPTPAPSPPSCAEVRHGSQFRPAPSDARQDVASSHEALPRVVALGGGTGLPNVLRGLRPLLCGSSADDAAAGRDRLVAIVATSDDGGSSGKLRAEFNVIPPGDIRNCLAALSDNHSLIADIFQYRFGARRRPERPRDRQPGADGARRRDQRLPARGGDRGAGGRRARHGAAGDERAGDAGRRVRGRPRAERRDGDRGGRRAHPDGRAAPRSAALHARGLRGAACAPT